MLYDGEFDKVNITQRILEIKKTVKDAKEIIRSLVSENNIDSSVFDVDNFICSKKDMFQNIIRNDIKFETNLNCKKNIEFDDNELNQIILNLIGNSLYAIEEKEKIELVEKKIVLKTSVISNLKEFEEPQDKEFCLLEIYDNGIGISQDLITRIFDPFFTTKPSGEGSGIGLSTVFNYVKKWEGHITVDSIISEYTVFKIYIPITIKSENKNIEGECFDEQQKSNLKLNILFVEDDVAIRQASDVILKKSGHFVHMAKNGKEALSIFKDNKNIDIIITDIIMPEMTGIELYNEVVKIKKDMKFLFTSGYRSGLLTEDMMKKYPFVQKPYDFLTLIKKLEETYRKTTIEKKHR